jgi:hypothetical protein
MKISRRLFPWYKEEEDDVKDVNTDRVVKRAKESTATIQKLAETYTAVGLTVKGVRHS